MSTHKYPNHDNNKFILLLQKGVYPYECMDDWEKSKKIITYKRRFLRSLIMEDITDADYMHAKIVCKEFEKKFFGEYHLYI